MRLGRCDETNRLLALKMAAGEAESRARFPRIDAFIDAALHVESPLPDFRKPDGDGAALDALLFETIGRAAALSELQET